MPVHLKGGTSWPRGNFKPETPSPKRYKFGDRREIGGVTHVRCRVFNHLHKSYVVNRMGTYKVEWVPEKDVDFSGLWPVRRGE